MKIRILAMAALVAVAMMAGCSLNHDSTNRELYDSYFTETSSTVSGKLVFDVPYVQVSEQRLDKVTCDSAVMVEALRTVFGDQIAFRHSSDARIVLWKSWSNHMGFGIPKPCTTTDMADYTDLTGRTTEITGVYHWNLPWSYSSEGGIEVALRNHCVGAGIEVAKQIKTLVDAESK